VPLEPVRVAFRTTGQPTPTIAATGPVSSNALGNLLNEDQRLVMQWTDRKFDRFFDERTFDGWSNKERTGLERRLIDTLKGPRSNDYFQAINSLAALRSTNALPLLRKMALDPGDKILRAEISNRARWMAIRALGIIGDVGAVPKLIHLLYHNNPNVRWWAQISLVRLTDQNFGKDWQAWGKWWNSQNGQPPFNPEIIHWWSAQAEPDELAESLAADDRKFLDGIQGRNSPTINDVFWQNLDRNNYQRYREELQKAPHVLVVRPTHYNLNQLSRTGIGVHWGWIDGKMANLCVSFSELVSYAYTKQAVWDERLMTRTEFPPELFGKPTNQFDVIDTLREQPVERLQAEIKQQLKERFGLAWHREMRDTDVFLITVKDPQLLESKISHVFADSRSIPELAGDWENYFGKPILDETGLTNRYDRKMGLIPAAYIPNRTKDLEVNNAFLAQYGLELVPTNQPMEWLAMERLPATNASLDTVTNTSTTTHIETMSCTLTFDENQKTMPNPTEADIRAAMISHEDDFGPIFYIGLDGTKDFLRIHALGKGRFSFEYTHDGNAGYLSKREDFSVEEAIKILTAYRNGSADWMTMAEWTKI